MVLMIRFWTIFFSVGGGLFLCFMWYFVITEASCRSISVRAMLYLMSVMVSGLFSVLITALWWVSNLLVTDYKQEAQENKKKGDK